MQSRTAYGKAKGRHQEQSSAKRFSQDARNSGGIRRPKPRGKSGYDRPSNQVYISYDRLYVNTLAAILDSFEGILREAVPNLIQQYPSAEKELLAASLWVETMHTGQSIKFSFGGVEITIDPGKHLVIPLVVVGILWGAFKTYNDYRVATAQEKSLRLDNQGKEIELESKKIDLEKKKAAWEKEKDSIAGRFVIATNEDKNIKKLIINGKVVHSKGK